MSGYLTLRGLDWYEMFVPTLPLFEVVIRGSLVYLALFTLLRVVLKREEGELGLTDVLVVVLIADAAQNAMAEEYRSITDGILLVAVIIFWSYALNWLGYHIPAFQKLIHPPPLLLIEDGKPIRKNMRRELLTEIELTSLLREQGVEDISNVRRAYLETDGRLSVLEFNGKSKGPPDRHAI